ncbi:MAG: hypothetical protein AAB316_04790 [Bacteroidota bacterium]
MKDSFPRLENILTFLQSKGWTIADKTKLFIYLDPPPHYVFDEPFQYTLPAREEIVDYKKFIWYTVNSISEFYEVNFDALYNLFSQKPEDYKKMVEVMTTAETELVS